MGSSAKRDARKAEQVFIIDDSVQHSELAAMAALMADAVCEGEGFLNLDAMAESDLRAAWSILKSPKYKSTQDYIAEAYDDGNAVRDLAEYAYCKVSAMQERVAGRITTAAHYEAILEDIYAALPGGAKW